MYVKPVFVYKTHAFLYIQSHTSFQNGQFCHTYISDLHGKYHAKKENHQKHIKNELLRRNVLWMFAVNMQQTRPNIQTNLHITTF